MTMRLSCEKDDPGYPGFERAMSSGKRIVVKLDGEIVPDAITADENLGFVKLYQRNVDGRLLVSLDGDLVLTEERRGHVEIELASH